MTPVAPRLRFCQNFIMRFKYFLKVINSFTIRGMDALEAKSGRGLVAHGMHEFDYQKARDDLEIPDNFDLMAMIAIGKKGPKENLPANLQEKENPNYRKPLNEIIMEGSFKRK